jgi:hypothetical protein
MSFASIASTASALEDISVPEFPFTQTAVSLLYVQDVAWPDAGL